ncbi:septum-promoting GTP-binding protein 1 [Reticulomyxa filosa]|uniref:Septum-promoting GTP-binding protein 1 n=1 Tax=Reticulomyxa filosa TaxID=46433 RepID=X6LWR5_RETFI|nr:septum-promoting GTP-binding protein 1 [Reticulomyxa filosa]|eukprot:ETO06059.1 septum-promoting GTP-binding protein 1 [Reticulomyxa filosa]
MHKTKRHIKVPDSRLLCDLLLMLPQKKKKKTPNKVEKTIHLKNVNVNISICDLGGQKDFSTLMQLVCSEAKVVLFAFDLTAKQSLHSVKIFMFYIYILYFFFFLRKKRGTEKKNLFQKKNNVVRILQTFFYKKKKVFIGAKYDLFDGLPNTYKQQLTTQARKFAPLVYCSSVKSINVTTIFQVIIINVFNIGH